MFRYLKYIIFIIVMINNLHAQVEHVNIYHPVYYFLNLAEIKGLLPYSSLDYLPLERSQVVEYLKKIRESESKLSENEKTILLKYETEFEIKSRENSVVFYSGSDSSQIFFKGIFSSREKFIYHYNDSNHKVNFLPLANIKSIFQKSDSSTDVIYGNLGFRLHGTLSGLFGYNMQVTNGQIVSGDRMLALNEKKLKSNVKFAILKSDFDFVESHIRFQYDWFYAIIGRENRLVGSGLNQRMYLSDNAPAMDAFSVGGRFSNFEYRFDHFSMIAYPDSQSSNVGFMSVIPPKYMSMHTFTLKQRWGELSYIQSIVYSGRAAELAYLTPLSFTKSLEHSLHDRDKSMMGFFGTIRPFNPIQIKGSWMLEDIIFSRIGTGYWSNKTAWNISVSSALPFSSSLGIEYSRIEPYMFTHFNYQNNRTNDGVLIGTYLNPNSDETSLVFRWFWGDRYPLTIKTSYLRHGENIVDSNGKIIRNVGADPRYCIYSPPDSQTVTFLDGNLVKNLSFEINAGWEFIRGFSLQAGYSHISGSGKNLNNFLIGIVFDNF